jgi:hypothetical protein
VPAPADGLPILAVFIPAEHKTSVSEGGAPLYRAALTLHVEVRVASADPVKVVSDLDALIDQAQIALLCNPEFMRTSKAWPIEYVTEIIVRSQIDGDGENFIGKGFVSDRHLWRRISARAARRTEAHRHDREAVGRTATAAGGAITRQAGSQPLCAIGRSGQARP